MLNTEKKLPSADDSDRAERLREVLEALGEANKRFPVIVEGKRDATALKQLGLGGDIITINRGKGLYEFCEEIIESFPKVILLPDWDQTGENLFRTLSQYLSGHWEDFANFRYLLRILCQKDVKDIEGIPKLLLRLERNEYPG